MSCQGYYMKILSDGVPLGSPLKDTGCVGSSHTLSIQTNLPGNLAFYWKIDGKIVSYKQSYLHIFSDTKLKNVEVGVSSSFCSLHAAGFRLKGKQCTACSVGCINQTAKFPAGEILYLQDESGKRYNLEDNIVSTCLQGSNHVPALAVKRAIKQGTNCTAPTLNTGIYFNKNNKDCLSLVISNSPIRFSHIRVGTKDYLFDRSKCR